MVPDTGSWWYDGQDRPVSTGLNAGRCVANAGTSIRSLMNITAMVNGKLPPQQQRDIGYRVKRVTNLRTGKRMEFDQQGGSLTIKGITDWDVASTAQCGAR